MTRKAPPRKGKPAKGGKLRLILGDQMDAKSAIFDDADADGDTFLMAEVLEESTHVPSHRQRTVLFLSAMRHFAEVVRGRGFRVRYVELDDPANTQTLGGELGRAAAELEPAGVAVVLPGDHRVAADLAAAADRADLPLDILPDRHYFVSPEDYAEFLGKKSTTRMEFFYRWMRKRVGVLMDGAKPVGGEWNYDADNRGTFAKGEGGLAMPPPLRFKPDAITRAVIKAVAKALPDNPGDPAAFDWPVTAENGEAALDDFIKHRLPLFGRYQDAMLNGQPWLYHSVISCALNLKLIDPRDVVARAEGAYGAGKAPLEAVEGFIRQVLGWREFIRGTYFRQGPGYRESNHLGATGKLPAFYWTGETDMACMADAIAHTLDHAYSHHIQRLMVTGNFALVAGIEPVEVDDWYLAMYIDATDQVSLPNTHGMALHADGGVVGSKPYAASGKYIQRMSDHCALCPFDPGTRTGPKACPITTFYWDFLLRHEAKFAKNPRMAMVLKNATRLADAEKDAIRATAHGYRKEFGIG